MAKITGATAHTPRGDIAWRPAAFVATSYEWLTQHATDQYVCLGVIGNWSHLTARNPGDHTPYSAHDIWVGGKHYVPKKGWVYAFDAHVPEPDKFEKWFLGRLRAGFYPGVKYWNINHRHWNRAVIIGGVPFGKSSHSGDGHLHVSGMPGSEYLVMTFLADYEAWRTTGVNVPTAAPAPTTQTGPVDGAARRLKTGIKKGAKGRLAAIAQAGLVAYGYLPKDPASVDGDFGPRTDAALRKLQKDRDIPVTGVIDTATWDKLFPEDVETITRGDTGRDALLMQALLLAHGFNPAGLDGDFGDGSVTALKRFQVAAKVKNSVVKGKGDGIGGDATWVALLTV